jgi:hypothetical protein
MDYFDVTLKRRIGQTVLEAAACESGENKGIEVFDRGY